MIDSDTTDSIRKENLDAFDKLFKEKEHLSERDQNKYRYYEDAYHGEYRWTTHKQEDGKFHATILKYKKERGWGRMIVVKKRYFRKRSTTKKYCLQRMLKARKHQLEVINRREEKKQSRLDLLPKLTKTDEQNSKITHYEDLIKKAEDSIIRAKKKFESSVRSAETRKRAYRKKIKYHQKRVLVLN